MLSDGIGADDYEVIIGVGVCTSKSLTGNELSCKPPTEEPDSGNDQTLYCTESSELPVNVSHYMYFNRLEILNDSLTYHSYR